jgi:histidinol-phosphate aminotransferase
VRKEEDFMSVSRRTFVKTVGAGGAGALSTALFGGRQALARFWPDTMLYAASTEPLLLHNNENPLGPGKAALDAIHGWLQPTAAEAGRYISNVRDLAKAIATHYGVAPENVLIGNGSSQILETATWILTGKTKPLVTAAPTYEECTSHAKILGTPVQTVPVDATLRLNLEGMAAAAKGAGLVFVNNPNNPTATIHSGDAIAAFVDRVLTVSPDTTIVIDEAYHDYVTDRSYATQVPLALKNPRVIVARTFSKAHGLAGMRVGYAIGHATTIGELRKWHYSDTVNLLGIAAATASIADAAHIEQEKTRNTEARDYTTNWFKKAGFKTTDSQANFIFAEIRRPAKQFRQVCQEQGVLVARDFPPFEKTHVRISIGTLEEMQRATAVFAKALAVPAATAA